MKINHQSGFTLIEMVIALLIISIALLTVSKIMIRTMDISHEFKYKLLADWVAENKLEQHRANRDWLASGIVRGKEIQAGITFNWQEEIIDTPNPSFKKVIINVYSKNYDYSIIRMVGFLVRQP
ncbi:MAG: type II secretion system minor pseudopilin GspI [Methylophilaceae bacterium]|nr:type II secretion system minor pseudopilin GspI [Methylophilaceae bacterium]